MLTGAAVVGVNDGRDVGRTDGRDVGAAVVGVADGRDVGDGLSCSVGRSTSVGLPDERDRRRSSRATVSLAL
jgi:hypothetical protein